MRPQQIRGVILLAVIVISAILYRMIFPPAPPVESPLHQARVRYEIEKLTLKQQTLQRNNALVFYGLAGLVGMLNLAVLIVAIGIARAKLTGVSVCSAQIGEHSKIPVHVKDLRHFYPIAVNLSLAEIEASASSSHERAYQLSRQMIEDITTYTRALAGKRGLLPEAAQAGLASSPVPLPGAAAPAFADLLRNGSLAPGTPLILGYHQGQPQYRELEALKSVAVAGWQGSGKTLSMAYLIASAVLTTRVQVSVIDPHRQHPESLSAIIQPLTATGRVQILNPFDTPRLLEQLNRILDRRLAGEDPDAAPILLVIDELARMARMECFDHLLRFLERCTEETRKAKITFLGGSPKWTARYFKGRADIRNCMNSMLIHKTKPSQADLLLEDTTEKKLVKQIHRPGEAILVTDFAAPVVVAIPFCTRQDMESVAQIVGQPASETRSRTQPASSPAARPALPEEEAANGPEIISFARCRVDRSRITAPEDLTREVLVEQIARLKDMEPDLTQAELARRAGIPASTLSRILNGKTRLQPAYQGRLYQALFQESASRQHVLA